LSALKALLNGDGKTLETLHDEELGSLGYRIARDGWDAALSRVLKALEGEVVEDGEKGKGKGKERQVEPEDQEQGFELNCSEKGSRRRELLIQEIWRGLSDSDPTSGRSSSNSSARTSPNTYSEDILLRVFNLLVQEKSYSMSQINRKRRLLPFRTSLNQQETSNDLNQSLFGSTLTFHKASEVLKQFLERREVRERAERRLYLSVQESENLKSREKMSFLEEEAENRLIFELLKHVDSKSNSFQKRRELLEELHGNLNQPKDVELEKDMEIESNWPWSFLQGSQLIRFLLERNAAFNQTEDLYWSNSPESDSSVLESEAHLDSQNSDKKSLIISILRKLTSSTSTPISAESLRQGRKVGQDWLKNELSKRDSNNLENDLHVRKRLKLVSFGISVRSVLIRGCLKEAFSKLNSESKEDRQDLMARYHLDEAVQLLKALLDQSLIIKTKLENKWKVEKLGIGEISRANSLEVDFERFNEVLRDEVAMVWKIVSNFPVSVGGGIYDRTVKQVGDRAASETELSALDEEKTLNPLVLINDLLRYLQINHGDYLKSLFSDGVKTPISRVGEDQHVEQMKVLLNNWIENCFALSKSLKFEKIRFQNQIGSLVSSSRLQSVVQKEKKDLDAFLLSLGPEWALNGVMSIIKSSSSSPQISEPQYPRGISTFDSTKSLELELSPLKLLQPIHYIQLVEYLDKMDGGNGGRVREYLKGDVIANGNQEVVS